jgi:hypothetical protein
MRGLRARVLIALDEGAVAGAVLAGTSEAPRVRSFARAPLAAGALVVDAMAANVVRPAEVVHALKEVAAGLDGAAGPVTLVLPDGVGRTALLELPGGVAAREYARYRITPGLPYPPEEALVDVLPLGGGRAVAAAIRRSVVEGYEAAAAAASIKIERLDLAPLAALSALVREGRSSPSSVDVVLGDRALSLFAWHEGAVRAVRSRLRAAGEGEPQWLAREVDRTAALAGNGGAPRVRVVGTGALALLQRWLEAGRAAEPGWRAEGSLPVDPSELAWLGAALG